MKIAKFLSRKYEIHLINLCKRNGLRFANYFSTGAQLETFLAFLGLSRGTLVEKHWFKVFPSFQ